MDESQQGWNASAHELWDELIYGEGAFRIFRLLIGLLVVIGFFWSLFVFKNLVSLGQSNPPAVTENVQAQAEEGAKLDALVKSYRHQALMRSGSGRLAELAQAAGQSPFAEPASLKASVVAAGRSGPALPIEVPPPNVNVKAVMLLGKASVAVVDIDGVGQNLIVKPGFSFAGRKGKVVSITSDKLVFLWNGKRQETLATSLLGGF